MRRVGSGACAGREQKEERRREKEGEKEKKEKGKGKKEKKRKGREGGKERERRSAGFAATVDHAAVTAGLIEHALRSGDMQHAERGKGTAIDFGIGRRNTGKDFGRLGARTEKDSKTIRAQRRKSFENYF
jgi:hypothetical protein